MKEFVDDEMSLRAAGDLPAAWQSPHRTENNVNSHRCCIEMVNQENDIEELRAMEEISLAALPIQVATPSPLASLPWQGQRALGSQ